MGCSALLFTVNTKGSSSNNNNNNNIHNNIILEWSMDVNIIQ